MGIVDTVEGFIFQKAAARAAVTVAQGAAAFALAHSDKLAGLGLSISVNPDLVAAGLMMGAHVAAQWLGHMLAGRFPTVAHMLGADA